MELALRFIYMLVILYAIAPLNTLIHEFGHAIPSLLFGADRATISLGNEESRWTAQLGRLILCVSLNAGWVGFYRTEKVPPVRSKRVIIGIMGPVFSLLTAAIWWWLSLQIWADTFSLDFLMRGAGYAALFQFVMTVIPMRYGEWNPGYAGYSSDGMNVLREFRPEPSAKTSPE